MSMRTDYCGALREKDIGRRVTVCGWVQTVRDMGGVIFLDLRDREGVLQVVCNAALLKDRFSVAEELHNQYVISVGGEIRLRDAETLNPKIETGTIELAADTIELLSESDPLPFAIEDDTPVREDLRLKYRFLDLRRPVMLRNLQFRHRVQKAARDYLDADGFIEVETPLMTISTPEGARDYLVPSRVHPGEFYALPQSPQIFKQLLMVGGIDKYYQVARCFRDEDLRADRQPEFTQVDMEMSFRTQEDILQHLEKLFKHIFKEVMGREITEAFPRLTWTESMDTYGCDKPDLRFGLPIVDVTEQVRDCAFSVFRGVVKTGGIVRAICVKGKADFARSEIESLTELAQKFGAKGMAWIAVRPDGTLHTILDKYFTAEQMDALLSEVNAEPGDFVLFCADKLPVVRRVLCGLRLELGDRLGLRNPDEYRFAIITDFPQFEWSEEQNRFLAMHHPFTMPYPEDVPYLLTDPARVRAQAYDVVLNGIELGSGSIRIHRRDVQEKMFEALGFSKEQIEEHFGFMVHAFRYGTPPHGGFAFGLDRLVMMLLGAESLREVIAFPKNKDAVCPLTGAPGRVERKQLEELGLTDQTLFPSGSGAASAEKKAVQMNVDTIARLARLTVPAGEKDQLVKDMEAIVGFADELSAVRSEGVAAMEHIVPMKNVFHEDVSEQKYTREELFANAPTHTEEYIYVPRVVE